MINQSIALLKKGGQWLLKHRNVVLVMVCMLCCMDMMAQGAGAFASAAAEIKTYQEPVKKLLYVIAGVVVLVGCFNIFHKMNNGDQDVKKTIMLTIGGCIAMVALANALPLFFS